MATLKSTGKHNRQARRKAGSEFAALAMKRDWGEWEDIDFEGGDSKDRSLGFLFPRVDLHKL